MSRCQHFPRALVGEVLSDPKSRAVCGIRSVFRHSPSMADIRIWTSFGDLASELRNSKPGGVKVLLGTRDTVTPTALTDLLIQYGSGIAGGVVSSWLYDLLKNHSSGKTKIQGRDAPTNEIELRVVIRDVVQQAEDEDSRQD
jgi:hypothetical protein